MTDPAASAGPSSTSWRFVNVVLVILALLLVAASAFFFIDSANASPADEQDAALSSEYRAVTKAAADETIAFLTVDYTDMDPLDRRRCSPVRPGPSSRSTTEPRST